MTQPSPGCPAWCGEAPQHTRSHMSAVHFRGPVGILLLQDTAGTFVFVNGLEVPVRRAGRLAALLELVGQDEAAADVRRLAEVACPVPSAVTA